MNLTSVDEDFLIACAKGLKLFYHQVENVVYDDFYGHMVMVTQDGSRMWYSFCRNAMWVNLKRSW